MSMHTSAGLTQRMLPSGHLELFCTETGRHIDCEPVATAMWIALNQHDGHVGRAATMLAGLWRADPKDVRAEMTVWAGTLCAIGLLTDDFLDLVDEAVPRSRSFRGVTRPWPARPGDRRMR